MRSIGHEPRLLREAARGCPSPSHLAGRWVSRGRPQRGPHWTLIGVLGLVWLFRNRHGRSCPPSLQVKRRRPCRSVGSALRNGKARRHKPREGNSPKALMAVGKGKPHQGFAGDDGCSLDLHLGDHPVLPVWAPNPDSATAHCDQASTNSDRHGGPKSQGHRLHTHIIGGSERGHRSVVFKPTM